MHPILVQDLASQHTADLDREAAKRRLVAIARSADHGASARTTPARLGPLALAAGRLRLAVRGFAG